jgi:HJR/Mrr/RecB family endonuclease
VALSYDGLVPVAEPQPPQPSAFNLTKERLAKFEHSFSGVFVWIFALVFVLVFIHTASEWFGRGIKAPDSLGALLSLFFVGCMAIMVSGGMAFVVTLPSAMIVEAIWKRMQPDYGRFREYEQALQLYKAEHTEWLKTQRSWWDGLHPARFEQEVAAFFKKQGHRVEWTGRSGDAGVDIRLIQQDGKKIIVQCKAHEKPISPGAVRDLFGTLLHEKADEAWLMSRSGFTLGARKFAEGKSIQLLNLDHILPGLGSTFDPRPMSRRT